MMPTITVIRSVEPELEPVPADVAYKIQSDNHSHVGTPAHTHRYPAIHHAALPLNDRSLRSNRRSIRHGCKQSQKTCRHVT